MWYYEFNGKPFGPVKLQGIMDALRLGRITSDTLVSHQGSNEWIRLADSELVALTRVALAEPAVNMPMPAIKKVNVKRLTRLFWWWVGLTGFSLLGDLILVIYGVFRYEPGAVILVNLPWMAASILEYLLTYRYWQTIQEGSARTTPGKAVGFQFIPFFSIYWLFPAYFGLAQDQYRFMDRQFGNLSKDRVKRPVLMIALSYVISYWLFIATIISLAIGTIIYQNTYYYSWSFSFYNNQIILIVAILLGLIILLRIAMFVDFYLSTRSILEKLDQS